MDTYQLRSLNIEQIMQSELTGEEAVTAWLTDLDFDWYFHHFWKAGYDLPTISQMTPQDLAAIGIKNPAHRMRLKEEISKLKISDGLPEHAPSTLEQWLSLIRLKEYLPW